MLDRYIIVMEGSKARAKGEARESDILEDWRPKDSDSLKGFSVGRMVGLRAGGGDMHVGWDRDSALPLTTKCSRKRTTQTIIHSGYLGLG